MTNKITINNKGNIDLKLADCFEHPTIDMMKAYAKSQLQFPYKITAAGFARTHVEPFIVACWVCQGTFATLESELSGELGQHDCEDRQCEPQDRHPQHHQHEAFGGG